MAPPPTYCVLQSKTKPAGNRVCLDRFLFCSAPCSVSIGYSVNKRHAPGKQHLRQYSLGWQWHHNPLAVFFYLVQNFESRFVIPPVRVSVVPLPCPLQGVHRGFPGKQTHAPGEQHLRLHSPARDRAGPSQRRRSGKISLYFPRRNGGDNLRRAEAVRAPS